MIAAALELILLVSVRPVFRVSKKLFVMSTPTMEENTTAAFGKPWIVILLTFPNDE